MCLSLAHGGYRCPCSGGIQPPITGPKDRAARAKALTEKRGLNAIAADKYRRNQALMAAEARQFVSRLPRNPTERRAALVTALADLPERGAVQPRRVLEEALSKTAAKPEPKPDHASEPQPYTAASPSPAVSPAPVPETPPASSTVTGWTPESARDAVADIVQGEFDKGRTPREIQGLMWEQMTQLSPSRDKALFGALTAAMKELEAYR